MEDWFEMYLYKKGYSINTVNSYIYWVKRVMKKENILKWEDLATKIGALCALYDFGGLEEEYGNQGKRTVINALKQFREFNKQFLNQLKSYVYRLKQK